MHFLPPGLDIISAGQGVVLCGHCDLNHKSCKCISSDTRLMAQPSKNGRRNTSKAGKFPPSATGDSKPLPLPPARRAKRQERLTLYSRDDSR